MQETMGQIIKRLRKERNLKDKKPDEALQMLKKMVHHDLSECSKYQSGLKMHTPLLQDVDYNFFAIRPNTRKRLLNKLNNPAFNELKENSEFLKLVESVH